MALFNDHTTVRLHEAGETAESLDLLLDTHSSTDFTRLTLKPDHPTRPCWVCPNGSIYVEMFANRALATSCIEFLVAIAEPESRPASFHNYKLTAYSLYAGTSVNMDTKTILDKLDRFSKNQLPDNVIAFVRGCTESYGKAKLVLKSRRLYVEAADDSVLRALIKVPAIWQARVHTDGSDEFIRGERPAEDRRALDEEDDDDAAAELQQQPSTVQTSSFEINPDVIEQVKNAALSMPTPCALMDEYDFARDADNARLRITLLGQVRDYQARALTKMFGNGRARSGVIVLPCGAGKTLTGISACCKIAKSTIIMCPNTNAVHQWVHQFKLWTQVEDRLLCKFTADDKDDWPLDGSAIVLFTTYTSLGTERRSEANRQVMERVRAREWGLCIADEVHQAPASSFRRALASIKVHCKLGLTATLVREDGKISDLNFLIGPKIYEADWIRLTEQGYLAKVSCVEVWCPMTPRFMREYLNEENNERRRFLHALNPNKVLACATLMAKHEQRGDKILVFSDKVAALKAYGKKLDRIIMYGDTSAATREQYFKRFRLPHGHPNAIQTLCLSSIGDQAIDLPDANVLIQVSSHFGSRRQEAQRLGRILRPKPSTRLEPGAFNAYFYTLVSTDTSEMYFSNNRRQYLVDQGYSFMVMFMERVCKPITVSSPDEDVIIAEASAKKIEEDNHEKIAPATELDEESGSNERRTKVQVMM